MAAKELNNTILKNSANLKAYYRFESGAETTDSSGNSNTLTNIGTPTYGAAVFGQGVNLASASSQAFSITDTAILKPTGAFTVGGWFKTSTTGATQHIFQSYSQLAAGFFVAGINLRITTANVIRLLSGKNSGTTQGTDYQLAAGATTVTDGNWHLAVGTWDGATLRVYIDGKHDGSAAWANAPVYAATNYVRVGCGNSNASDIEFFNGSLDDVFLLNGTALSADQIKELYEGRLLGEGWPQSGLVGLWHLNGNSTDFSGNNNHGTDTSVTYSQANGKFGQGAAFNGSSSKINLASSATLNPASITFSCWVKSSGATLSGPIWGATASGSSGCLDIKITTNKISVEQSGVAVLGGGNTTLSANTWYNIVVTYVQASGALVIYLNGNVDGTATNAKTLNTVATSFGLNNTTEWFTGILDEVQIYNVAKDANWVRKQYAWSVGKYL